MEKNMIDATKKGFGFGLGAATGSLIAQAHGVEIVAATRAVTGTAATLAVTAGKAAGVAAVAIVTAHPGAALAVGTVVGTAAFVEAVETYMHDHVPDRRHTCTIL
jgi:hypothetical protein